MGRMTCCPHPPLDPNRKLPNIYQVPLNDEDQKRWQEFKIIGEKAPLPAGLNDKIVEKCKVPIAIHHPIVSVVGEFAITAFNKAYQMEVNKDQHNILRDGEIMDCKFLRRHIVYYFFLSIEAVEEDNLGVYEALVLCEKLHGRITLMRIVRTNRTPVGKKAVEISHLFHSLRTIEKSLKGLGKDNMKIACKTMKGHKKKKPASELSRPKVRCDKSMYLFTKWTRLSIACGTRKGKGVDAKLICLKKRLKKTTEDLHRVLYLDTGTLFPLTCKQTTNQDVDADDVDPENDHYSGMVPRTSYSGYDFYNPLSGFSFLMM